MEQARRETTPARADLRPRASSGLRLVWFGVAALASGLTALATPAAANQAPVAGPNQTLNMDEDTTLAILLEGTDPDGDPLSATITGLSVVSSLQSLVDSSGDPVIVGSTLLDRQLFLTPVPNAAAIPVAVITYRVHDGTQNSSNTAVVTVNLHPVNDPPTMTLPTTLVTDEDETLNFVMGGFDIENDTFLCRFTVLADPDFGFVLYHGGVGGPFDMSALGGRDQMLNVPSDIALQWPMSLIPRPNECQDEEYNSFSYWLEEEIFGLHGPESHVVLQVRCINDAPQFAVTGQGTQTFATFTTTLAGSGAFTLPVLGLLDVDGVGSISGPDPGLARITVTTGSGGTIAVNEGGFPGTTFVSGPTSIVFDAVRSTVDAILATLVYTSPAAPAADTLTILVNDNGSNQGCADPSDGSTCPLVAGVNVDIAVDAGGTSPGAMSLTPGTGGFIPVDTAADDVTPNGNCTLREAVEASNDDIAVDGCPAGNGVDVIVLPTGTFPLSLGALPITDDAMIVGAGEALSRIDGLGLGAPFDLIDSLTLRDVSVIGLDGDGDGIRTPVDGQFVSGAFVDESDTTSTSFTDQHLGGTTFGDIVDNDVLDLVVTDAVNPQGVTIVAGGSAAEIAELEVCSTSVPIVLHGGETTILTCDVPTTSSISAVAPDPSVVGQPVTVSVAVAPLGVSGTGPVTGAVMINDGAGSGCTGALSGGTASCQLTPTVAGTRTWTATYSADGFFFGSADTLSHAVTAAMTATMITADTPDPSLAFQPFQVDVAVTALAPGSGTPSGNVDVHDGAGASCIVSLSAGSGSCMLTPMIAGTRNLTATYGGDDSYLTSATTESHRIDGTDYGDAPAPYPVTLSDDGARHAIGSLYLGAAIDADPDGQPAGGALGDDADGADDEDGDQHSRSRSRPAAPST